MSTLTLLDAAAAMLATVVVAQSLTLGVIQVLRIRESVRQQSLAQADAHRHGRPSPRRHPTAATWLLLTLLLSATVASGDVMQHLGLVLLDHWLSPVHTSALLLLGPAIWFYAVSITRLPSEAVPSWTRFLRHAWPAGLLAAGLAVAVLLDPWGVDAPGEGRSWVEVAVLIPIAAQILAYLGAVVWRVRRRQSRLEAQFSYMGHRRLNWLQAAAGTFALLVLVWIGTWTLPVAVSNILTNGLLAIDVAVLGVFGARQQNVFSAQPWLDVPTQPHAHHPHAASIDECHPDPVGMPEGAPPSARVSGPASDDDRKDGISAADSDPRSGKYAKSALSATVAREIADRLDDHVHRDKPYLECDLTLGDLASAIGATPHQLSQVLSTQLGLSFFDYVNGLRVDAVKATLSRPQSVGRPLLEIALECGFGSKSAFNEAFKRATGLSPSAYRRSLPASVANPGAPAPQEPEAAPRDARARQA